MESTVLANILAMVSTWFTSLVGWMGDILDFVVDQPLLLIMMILIPISGVAIGFISRLFSLRA